MNGQLEHHGWLDGLLAPRAAAPAPGRVVELCGSAPWPSLLSVGAHPLTVFISQLTR